MYAPFKLKFVADRWFDFVRGTSAKCRGFKFGVVLKHGPVWVAGWFLCPRKWNWTKYLVAICGTVICLSYVKGAAGMAAIQVMRALHTPLHDVTFGSGCRLSMHTCYRSKPNNCLKNGWRKWWNYHKLRMSVNTSCPLPNIHTTIRTKKKRKRMTKKKKLLFFPFSVEGLPTGES